tara:strand:- start:5774 stop:7813 length:2040 start_codon:yes stop_codon:yes gene_type:complete
MSKERFKNLLNETNEPVAPPKKSKAKARLRSLLQGLSLGTSDEIEAFLTSTFTDAEYEQVLNVARNSLADFAKSNPYQSMAMEGIGAVIPMLFTGGLGAVGSGARLANVARTGAATGGAYGFGTGEGGFAERAKRVPGGVAIGAAGAVVGDRAVKFGGDVLKALGSQAKLLVGRRGENIVNNEVQRLVSRTGKPESEVVQDLIDGKILSENETLNAAMKALRSQPGGEDITLAAQTRPGETRNIAMRQVDEALGGDGTSATVRRDNRFDEIKDQQRIMYEPFKTQQAPDVVDDAMISAVNRLPGVGKPIQKVQSVRAGEIDPMTGELYKDVITKVTDADEAKKLGIARGGFALNKKPSVEEIEMVRRGADAVTTKEFTKPGGGFVGAEYDRVAKELRDIMDQNLPALASTRAQAAAMNLEKDAFKFGEEALTGKPGEKMIQLNKLLKRRDDTIEAIKNKNIQGDELDSALAGADAELNAYRTGFLMTLQNKFVGKQKASMMKDLGDIDSHTAQVLDKILPEETVESVFKKLEVANEAKKASDRILRGSPTTEGINETKLSGSDGLLSRAAMTAMNPLNNPGMLIGQVGSALANKFGRGLTEAENRQLAKILTTTDPAILQRALVDDGALAKIGQMLSRGVLNPADRIAAPIARGVGMTQGAMVGGGQSVNTIGLLGGGR